MFKAGLVALVVLALPGAVLAQAKPKKIVCWQDEGGRRMCGDRIPPQYAKKERKIYDDRGRVVGTKAREKTAEEIAEEARVAKLRADETRRAREQVEYDKFLLQTYQAASEIEKARDERLKSLDYRIQLAEKSLKDTEASLQKLRTSVDAAKAGGKQPDAKQKKQLRAYEKSLAENQEGLVKLKAERDTTGKDFDRDVVRFRELQAQVGSKS